MIGHIILAVDVGCDAQKELDKRNGWIGATPRTCSPTSRGADLFGEAHLRRHEEARGALASGLEARMRATR